MNEKDSIKSHIDTLRAMLVSFMTAIFGIFGYIIIHIDNGFSRLQTILGIVALFLLCVGLAFVINQYLKFSKKLENAK
ncbi:hypothetical protein [Helicobacter sp. T3_23-1056]